MGAVKYVESGLADNEDLQEKLLEVTVKRYLYHDNKHRSKDKRMAQSYLRRANELAAKYDLQQFLRNLLNDV